MEKQLICITCPVGCKLTVTGSIEAPTITGNRCLRGIDFAKEELTESMRVLTTTVRLVGGAIPLLPVKTEKPIPLRLFKEAVSEVSRLKVLAPVKIYDVIVPNILNTGVNLIATRSIPSTSLRHCKEP